jgi:carbonic anhydrase
MTGRREVLKMIAGAAVGLCPTCVSIASAFASEKKSGNHEANPHWGYKDGASGPAQWGELTPANQVCSVGFQQSPIDLTKGLDARLGGIDINFKPMPLHVVNNGHTIQVNCEAGSDIRFDGKTYRLLQYHFHHPSEHALNGKRFQMEAHFVHVGDDGTLAVLGVFFKPGQENAALGKIWSSMPTKAGEENKGGKVSPAALLPQDRAYYRYYGSLTTPPCSEKVIWSVYAQPLEASMSQFQEFARLFPMNARPLQLRNRRYLLKSN